MTIGTNHYRALQLTNENCEQYSQVAQLIPLKFLLDTNTQSIEISITPIKSTDSEVELHVFTKDYDTCDAFVNTVYKAWESMPNYLELGENLVSIVVYATIFTGGVEKSGPVYSREYTLKGGENQNG